MFASYFWFVLDTPLRWIFGRDVFISYSRFDGLDYAENLASQIADMHVSRYLDMYETTPDSTLPKKLRRALNRASLLVVIITPGAAMSDHVLREVEEYTKIKRPILPVNVDGALTKSRLRLRLVGAVQVAETKEAIQIARPSVKVLERLRNTRKMFRQENRLRLGSGTATLLLVVSIAGALWSVRIMTNARADAALAQQQAEVAKSEITKAQAAKERADADNAKAQANEKVAIASAKTANDEAINSKLSAEEANHSRADAEAKAGDAEDRRVKSEKQTQNSIAERLASEADRNAVESPQLSLLLAVEALNATEKVDEPRVFAAEAVLRRQLSLLGGLPLGPMPADAPAVDTQAVETVSDDNISDRYKNHPPPRDPDDEEPWFVGDVSEYEGEAIIRQPKKIARFSRDNHWFLSFNNKELQLWDLTQKFPEKMPAVASRLKSDTASIDLSSDGNWLMAIDEQIILLWDLRQSAPAAKSITIPTTSTRIPSLPDEAAFTQDNRYLVLGDIPGAPLFYDLSTQRFTAGETASAMTIKAEDASPFKLASDYWPNALFSIDRRWLVYSDEQSTTWIYDLQSSRPPSAILRLPESAFITFSGDSRWLVTKTLAGKAQIRNLTQLSAPAITVALHDHDSSNHLTNWNYLKDNRTRTRIAISHDGSRLLERTGDDEILWNLDDPKTPKSNVIGMGEVRNEVDETGFFSMDGRWLIGKSGWMADLRLPSKEDDETTIDRNAGGADHISLSPNGRWVLFINYDGQLILRDISAPDSSKDIKFVVPQGIGYANFSPDNTRIVFTEKNTIVIINIDDLSKGWSYDRASYRGALILRGHEGTVNRCVFSSDGRWLVSIGEDNHPRLWDLTRKFAAVQPTSIGAQSGAQNQFSPDGRWFASCGPQTPCALWNVQTQKLDDAPLIETNSTIHSPMVFSDDSRWLFTVDKDGHGMLWNLTNIPKPKSIDLPGFCGYATFSPGARRLITPNRDGTIRVWDLSVKATSPTYFDLPEQYGPTLTFTADSRWLFVGSSHLWNLNLKEKAKPNQLLDNWFVASSDNGQWVVTKSYNTRLITLWELAADAEAPLKVACKDITKHADAVFGVTAHFSPNDLWLLTQDGSQPRLWDLRSRVTASSPQDLNGATSENSNAEMSPNGRWVAVSASGQNGAYVLDLENSGRKQKLFGRDNTWLKLGGFTFSPNSGFLLTYSALFEVKGGVFKYHELPRPEKSVRHFSPDSHWLLEQSGTTALLRDLTGDLDTGMTKPSLLTDFRSNFRFSADSPWLFNLDKQTELQRVWNLQVKASVSHSFLLSSEIVAVNDKYFWDNKDAVWFMNLPDLKQLALKVAGRSLTTAERDKYLIPADNAPKKAQP